MKAPTKPIRPSKPCEPSRDKKHHIHKIDVSELFSKDKYWNEDGVEITAEEYYKNDEQGDMQTEEYSPTIGSLLAKLPAGVNANEVEIELDTYCEGRDYPPVNTICLIYKTPYEYDTEMYIYKRNMDYYDNALIAYNTAMVQYKKELGAYKEAQETERLKKKKAALEKELLKINGRGI